MEDAHESIDHIKIEFKKLESSWVQENAFHKDMQIYDRILLFRRNIKIILDQLNDIMNMSTELKQLEEFYNDPANFEYIQNQLEWLYELKEDIAAKFSSNNIQSKEKMQQVLDQFQDLDKHYDKFYENIFNIILTFINFNEKNPEIINRPEAKRTLKKAVKILENGDKLAIKRGKDKIFEYKCKQLIKETIDER